MRYSNIKEAFTVKIIYLVKGCNVLLVDGMITTGSTIRKCAKVLKKLEQNLFLQ
ncbi:hypothetical protein MHYMCMPSP_00356 [Hyalomma marginatum]|uniref:Phosphoribosyltransferase domain-containing protein n=1 Tax=Hyalomma marginatum TaxID=34627 RepID=A0A8S4C0V8_9ACAR|nr:hypothetical protein MHYMCMPASI_00118 [Hyalomma marginatum]CAG7590802.1 hypothetical protein MHYMCMPSP_00356 [Hyalomma marginatum]